NDQDHDGVLEPEEHRQYGNGDERHAHARGTLGNRPGADGDEDEGKRRKVHGDPGYGRKQATVLAEPSVGRKSFEGRCRAPRYVASANRATSSAEFLRPSFFVRRYRWVSTLRGERESSWPIWALVFPRA